MSPIFEGIEKVQTLLLESTLPMKMQGHCHHFIDQYGKAGGTKHNRKKPCEASSNIKISVQYLYLSKDGNKVQDSIHVSNSMQLINHNSHIDSLNQNF